MTVNAKMNKCGLIVISTLEPLVSSTMLPLIIGWNELLYQRIRRILKESSEIVPQKYFPPDDEENILILLGEVLSRKI